MKLNKAIGLLLFGLIAFSGSAFAQSTQNVTINSIHTYTSTPETGTTANSYKWVLLDGSTPMLTAKFAAETAATVSIDWSETNFTIGKTYRLNSQIIDDNGCISEIVYADITIVGAGSVLFADAVGNDNVETCSLLAGDTENTTNFTVNFTGGVAPYTLTYDVKDITGVTKRLTKTFDATTGILSAQDWENNTTSQQTYTITLISAMTKDGQDIAVDNGTTTTLTEAENNVRTIKVHPKPVIKELTLN
ncbi:hypothetical protein [Marinifilum fragile]|uniref:hypothetical protein n=1 Tax=Marinifilum fragile TaxID=570161 RepID=UPI002AA963B5|nr:hypothetical protein [Marinifilum fragile]